MRIFLKIVFFPLILIALIVGFTIKGICYLLALLLDSIAGILGILQYILGTVFLLAAGVGTYTTVKAIQSGTLTLMQGVALIVCCWIVAILLSLVFYLCETVAFYIEEFGDFMGDLALSLLTM